MEAGKNFLLFFFKFHSHSFTHHLTSINSQMSTHNNNAQNFIFPPVAQGVGGGEEAGTGIGGEEGKNFFFSMFLSKFIHIHSSCSH